MKQHLFIYFIFFLVARYSKLSAQNDYKFTHNATEIDRVSKNGTPFLRGQPDFNIVLINPGTPPPKIQYKDLGGNTQTISALVAGNTANYTIPSFNTRYDRFKFRFVDAAGNKISNLKKVKKNISVRTEQLVNRFDFLFEEDFLLEPFGLPQLNEDRDYTGGFSFIFSGPFANSALGLSHLHRGIDRILFANYFINCSSSGKYNALSPLSSIKIGGSAFSPAGKNLKVTDPVEGDRPYASLVYISHGHTYVSNTEQSAINTELVLGVLGLYVFREMQTGIHRWNKNGLETFNFSKESDPDNIIKPYYPLGWHNQVSDGGELTGLYSIAVRQKFIECLNPAVSNARIFDLVLMESANIGYYNNVRVGFTSRFGKIKQKWYSFNSSPVGAIQAQQFNPNKVAPGSPHTLTGTFTKQNQFFVFLSARANVVVYNALMGGQFKPSIYTLNNKTEVNHLIGEGEFGLFWQFCGVGLTSSLSGRTPDFHTSTTNRPHLWANIYLSFFFD